MYGPGGLLFSPRGTLTVPVRCAIISLPFRKEAQQSQASVTRGGAVW
jgi:hypothetical protein